MRYKYYAAGSGGNGQTWETRGTVSTAREGDFPIALQQAMMNSFEQLTKGKAIYGNPGVGCTGPYSIHKFTVERDYD